MFQHILLQSATVVYSFGDWYSQIGLRGRGYGMRV